MRSSAREALVEREELLAAIDDRIDRFNSSGESAAVLDEAALAEAHELARLGDGGLEVAYALGMFYHCRLVAAARLGSVEADEAEALAALGYFETLYRQAPDLLPAGMWEVCAEAWPVTEGLLAAWNTRVGDLERAGRARGDARAIDDAVWLIRQVLSASEVDQARRAGYLSNLSRVLRARFLMTESADDIDESIQAGSAAVEAAGTDADRSSFRSNLAVAYTARFERHGDVTDLGLAIDQLRLSVVDTSQDHPAQAGRLSNLGSALANRFIVTGDRADVNEAIALLGRAVDLAEDKREQAEYLSNRSAAFISRYTHTGDTADLDLAVECGREAVQKTEADRATWHAMLNNLGLALRTRYQRTLQKDDIDEAVAVFRAATAQVPPGHPQRAGYLSNLSSVLRVRFGQVRDRADIDEAVRSGQEAVGSSGADNASRARYYSNLGAALSQRFGLTGAPDDLDAAVAAERAAAELVPPHDPIRATIFANLGLVLRKRAEHHGGPDDLAGAAEAYAASAATPSAPPLVRATSAQDCGGINADRHAWPAAAQAFELAVSLLGEVTDNRLARDDQQYHLTRLSGLGCAAAATALEIRDPATALPLLERGRGVMLAQLLAIRGDLTELQERDRELAREFENVQRELNQQVALDDTWSESRSARRHRLSVERDRIVATVRELPGFEHFLLPRIDDELIRSPVDGPVVAVNVAGHRCDALIVSADGIRHVPLPNLTRVDAISHANSFLAAVHDHGPNSDQQITAVLGWMWDAFAERILADLGLTNAADPDQRWPQLWWMPTGALSVLPVHAAGYHDIPGRAVLDRAVSSYTPTLRALRQAGRQARPDAVGRPLVVAVPEAPDQPPLPGTAREAVQVAGRLPAGTTTLVGPEASRARVLQALSGSTWVHFACHASTDPANPSDSHLVLHDGLLRVRELSALHVQRALLAYLSACTTAFGGTELLDEAIHISSAFQLAGYPHVIGTLWRVGDVMARKMANLIYEKLMNLRPAEAVHVAVHHFRRRYPNSPYRWAAHIHIGS